MKIQLKHFFLGLFILMALGILAWFLLFLRPSVGDEGKILKIRFSNIEKIAIGTRVTFAGKPVGEVIAIQEIFNAREQPTDTEGNLYFYELILKIDSRVRIFNYDEILFSTSGLLGEKSIAIIPKPAPLGYPPPHEITNETLYAQSTDKLGETLNRFADVAATLQDVAAKNQQRFEEMILNVRDASYQLNLFLKESNQHSLASHLTQAAQELALAMAQAKVLFREAIEKKLVENAGKSVAAFQDIVSSLHSKKGTLGKLIQNDDVYCHLNSVLCRFETLLYDLNHYGLLFQYNKRWQRLQKIRRYNNSCLMSSTEEPSAAIVDSFEKECNTLLDDVEQLQENIKLYNQR